MKELDVVSPYLSAGCQVYDHVIKVIMAFVNQERRVKRRIFFAPIKVTGKHREFSACNERGSCGAH